MQIYRELDIGSAKPTQRRIRIQSSITWLMNSISQKAGPRQNFVTQAEKIYQSFQKIVNSLIMAGGTGPLC